MIAKILSSSSHLSPDSIIKIVKLLFNEFGVTHRTLASIPDVEVIGFAGQCNYQSNWKPETRAKVIKEKGAEYYNLLFGEEIRPYLMVRLIKMLKTQ